MALINCPECDKEISSSARACPKCGFDLESMRKNHIDQKYRKQNRKLVLVVFILIALIILVGYIGSKLK